MTRFFLFLSLLGAAACAPSRSLSAQLAQAQLDAYNGRDLDAFARLYHPDVEVYAVRGGKPLMRGMTAFRANYSKRFAASPKLHAALLGRLVMGRFVVDHEHVTGFGGPGAGDAKNGVVRAIAIYEIEGSLIRRVWFLRE